MSRVDRPVFAMSRTRLLAVLLPAALLWAAGTPALQHYVVAEGSVFRIDGSSTMGRYSCIAGSIAGAANVPAGNAERTTAEVTVGVGSFDCGVSRMNRDFRNALRSREHPTIRFTLDAADVLSPEGRPGAWVPVRVRGRLRLAGAERAVDIRAEGRRMGEGRVRVRGEHPMRMTDFGVDPPSGLLGAVRAHDRVVVRFELVAEERGQ